MKTIAIPIAVTVLSLGTAAQDCNLNGIPDDQDITAGTSADCNANGIPDECELGDPTVVLTWDFEAGSTLPPGVGTYTLGFFGGTTMACGPVGSCGGGRFYYFGLPSQCDYDTTPLPDGQFGFVGVQIPEGVITAMSFCYALQVEGGGCGHDNADIHINFQKHTRSTISKARWIGSSSGNHAIGSWTKRSCTTPSAAIITTAPPALSTRTG